MPSSLTPSDPASVAHAPDASPELFGQDQLERHAIALAGLYALASEPVRGQPLLPRLDRAAEELDAAYRFLSNAPPSDGPAVGSEDWLRDNHHVVQDQVREVRQDLPRKFYYELPKLADGPYAGYPRVYVIARELIAHTAGRFDLRRSSTSPSRISASRRSDDRRDLGDPDHAAPGAGRGVAAPRVRRWSRRARSRERGASLGAAARRGRPTTPRRSSTRCCATNSGRRAARCPRRSSSS